MLINKAFLKYGYSNFKLEILEYCDRSNNINREQYYLDLIKPNYNILQIAGSALGYKHSEEALEKMKKAALGRARDEETKNKIRASLKATLLNNVKAASIRAKVGASTGTKVKLHDLNSNTTVEYTSFSKAAVALHTTHTTISTYIKSQKP